MNANPQRKAASCLYQQLIPCNGLPTGKENNWMHNFPQTKTNRISCAGVLCCVYALGYTAHIWSNADKLL